MHQPFKFANHRTEDTEDTDKMGPAQLFNDGLDYRFGAGGTRVASTQIGAFGGSDFAWQHFKATLSAV
jgi:hypothetical protein